MRLEVQARLQIGRNALAGEYDDGDVHVLHNLCLEHRELASSLTDTREKNTDAAL